MVQARAILAMADQSYFVHDLSNGTIFNDPERPLPRITRSRHYLMLNISGTVRDAYILVVSMEY